MRSGIYTFFLSLIVIVTTSCNTNAGKAAKTIDSFYKKVASKQYTETYDNVSDALKVRYKKDYVVRLLTDANDRFGDYKSKKLLNWKLFQEPGNKKSGYYYTYLVNYSRGATIENFQMVFNKGEFKILLYTYRPVRDQDYEEYDL